MIGTHAPAPTSHASHWSVHAALQHTPSTQKLLWHRSFAAHGWPFASFEVQRES
jgi:hypothetical protein